MMNKAKINKAFKYRQKGASLMEVLIAMTLSLIVTASMVALMANSLGSTARIIKMTKLTDDMRIAMQMMSRDVRRSSYNASSMFCYANLDCGTDGAATLAGDIDFNNSNECFTFLLDRDHDGDSTEHDGAANDNSAGGFRRKENADGVGIMEMWSGVGSDLPDCSAALGAGSWVQITNPDNMDIFGFTVDDNLSYTQEILNDISGRTVSQKVRKIRMNMRGRLVFDLDIVRRVEDVIAVRNDLLL
jgi:type II secretory pathway component PulJ